MLTRLPPSASELAGFSNAPDMLYPLLWQGAYPRIYDQNIPARQWLSDYLATYVQRDVRQILNVGNMESFLQFLRLCAGRTGQEINYSALGADAGVSHNTARAWLSILESSYIIHRLPAWHANVRKQITKTAKLHFVDSGLACHLLGIRAADQLPFHPLRGAIFESWVVSEIYKQLANRGEQITAFHYRESRGIEMDLMVHLGDTLYAIEIKSGSTISSGFFKNFDPFSDRMSATPLPRKIVNLVIYGGDASQHRSQGSVISWRELGRIFAQPSSSVKSSH